MVFEFPASTKDVRKLTYTVDYDSLMSLYRASRAVFVDPDTGEPKGNELTQDDEFVLAESIVDGVLNQFEAVFGIPLERLTLRRISSPIAMIGNGKLKVLHADAAAFVVDSLHAALFDDLPLEPTANTTS